MEYILSMLWWNITRVRDDTCHIADSVFDIIVHFPSCTLDDRCVIICGVLLWRCNTHRSQNEYQLCCCTVSYTYSPSPTPRMYASWPFSRSTSHLLSHYPIITDVEHFTIFESIRKSCLSCLVTARPYFHSFLLQWYWWQAYCVYMTWRDLLMTLLLRFDGIIISRLATKPSDCYGLSRLIPLKKIKITHQILRIFIVFH